MSGILERFFQVAMLLALMIMSMNVAIALFGETLTGETINVEGDPFSGISIVISDSGVRQVEAEAATPTQSLETWIAVLTQIALLVGGFQLVLLHILRPVGLGLIASFIVIIISFFQILGTAYLVWALVSAWKGGGSP